MLLGHCPRCGADRNRIKAAMDLGVVLGALAELVERYSGEGDKNGRDRHSGGNEEADEHGHNSDRI